MGVTIGAKESKSLPDQPQVTSYTSAGQTEANMKKKIDRDKVKDNS